MEYRSGQMDQYMKGIGRTARQMVKESLYLAVEIYMKVNGKIIKHMVLVYT